MDLNYYRAGAGEPLLLVHGLGSRWQVWEPVLPRLSREREVIAIDLPGFGASPMPPPGTPPGPASMTCLVGAFLERLGVQAPHVAGNSLGGQVTLELAKRGLARTATALSPTGFHNEREVVYQRLSLSTTLRAARLLAPVAESVLRPSLGRRLAFAQTSAHPERIPLPNAVGALRAFAGAPWFDATMPAVTAQPFVGGETIEVPVTIAWGERDHLLLPRQARRAGRAIPGARLITLRDCGHVPLFDDPVRVAEVVLEGSSR
jgi:pimeloyl-ACP methyl ester carboxylesterase